MLDNWPPLVQALAPSIVAAITLLLHRRRTVAEARKVDAEATRAARGTDHDLGEMLLKWTSDARAHAAKQQERADRLETALVQVRVELARWKRYAAALLTTIEADGNGDPPPPAAYGISDDC